MAELLLWVLGLPRHGVGAASLVENPASPKVLLSREQSAAQPV
ncbi:MAG: hypothetical protein ACLQHF_02445 [Terracidiphilus sp.]